MDLAMNHPFADRRAMVLDGVSRVGDVLEKYPILREKSEVSGL